MAAHRYWRILILFNNAAFKSVNELEMRTAPGGSNVCTGGTASADGNFPGFPASKAFDGDTANPGWQHDSNWPWLRYDFGVGNEKDIVEIRLWPNTDFDVNRTPDLFAVQSSDDAAAWTTEWYCYTLAWTMGVPVVFTKPGPITSARYWGVASVTTGAGNNQFSQAEVQMRESVGGADATSPGGTAFGPNFQSPEAAIRAFDNDNATSFAGNNLFGTPATLLWYDFGAGNDKAIVEYLFKARPDAFFTTGTSSGHVIASSDGKSFGIVSSYSGLTYTASGSERTHSWGGGGGGGGRRRQAICC